MLIITRNSFNGKFFHHMTKPELEYCMEIIDNCIKHYRPSTSGICIPDQERHQEHVAAWQTCSYNLNKLLKGENHAS